MNEAKSVQYLGQQIPQPPPKPITFRAALKAIMPQLDNHAMRRKRYADYLQGMVRSESDGKTRNGKIVGKISLRDALAKMDDEEKAEAICPDEFSMRAFTFLHWWKSRLTATRKEIGKAGAKKRLTASGAA